MRSTSIPPKFPKSVQDPGWFELYTSAWKYYASGVSVDAREVGFYFLDFKMEIINSKKYFLKYTIFWVIEETIKQAI